MKYYFSTLILISCITLSSNAQVSGYQGRRFMLTGSAQLSSKFMIDGDISTARPFGEASIGMIISRTSCLSVSARQLGHSFTSNLYYYVLPDFNLTPSPVHDLYSLLSRSKVQVNHQIFTLDYRTFLRKKAGAIAPCGFYFSASAGVSITTVTGSGALADKVFKEPFYNPVVMLGVGKQLVLLNRLLLDCGLSSGTPLGGFKTYPVPEASYYYIYNAQPIPDGEPETPYNRYYEGPRIAQKLFHAMLLNPYIKVGIIL